MNIALDFPARTADAVAAGERAEAWAAAAGCAPGTALRLALVIEELATNTIKYGYGQECDSPIRIGLAFAQGRLSLTYEDAAPPFDPLRQVAATTPGSAPVGGFGLHMVRGLAETMTYVREGERNVVSIVLVGHQEMG